MGVKEAKAIRLLIKLVAAKADVQQSGTKLQKACNGDLHMAEMNEANLEDDDGSGITASSADEGDTAHDIESKKPVHKVGQRKRPGAAKVRKLIMAGDSLVTYCRICAVVSAIEPAVSTLKDHCEDEIRELESRHEDLENMLTKLFDCGYVEKEFLAMVGNLEGRLRTLGRHLGLNDEYFDEVLDGDARRMTDIYDRD